MTGLRNWLSRNMGDRRNQTGRRVNRPAKPLKPAIEALEDRQLMSVISYDLVNKGPIIPNVQVETVFFGSVWTPGTPTSYQSTNSYELSVDASDLNTFFSTITKSTYLNDLSQYTGSNGAPGRGQWIGSDYVPGLSPNPRLSPLTTIQDSDITKMLQSEMDARHVPAADANKLYVVFLPPGEQTQADVGSGGGHHDSFTTSAGVKAYYAVIEHALSGFLPEGTVGAETRLQTMTEVASHELVEAITDPVVNTAWHGGQYGNEIGDITQAHPPAGGAMVFDYGYAVQQYWSEKAQTSVAPGGNSWLLGVTAIPQDLPGQYFTLYSVVNGVTNIYNLQINYQVQDAGGNPYQGSFTGKWGSTSVHGTLSLDNLLSTKITTIHVQVYSDSNGSLLFDGDYTAPDGNWMSLNGLEMWGTVYQNGTGVYAFGTAEYGAGPTQGSGGGGGGGYVPGRHPPIVPM